MRTLACIVLFSLALPAECETVYPFGKVFSSPELRDRLDEYRRSGKAEEGQEPDASQQTGSVRATDQVKFSGYVKRSDGSQTVWVDGYSDIGVGAGAAGARLDKISAGAAVFSARQSRAALKPGQTWMLNENRVMEGYQAPTATRPETEGESAGEGTE